MLFGKMMIGPLFLAANLATAGGAEPKDCSWRQYYSWSGDADSETYRLSPLAGGLQSLPRSDGWVTVAPSLSTLPDRSLPRLFSRGGGALP